MEFTVNDNEMVALCGLPHIQQLAYFRGIRPYMNVKTGIVGVDRGISYQSIAEQLYIEPHQGIKSVSFSRAQTRRAIAGLERAGLIKFESRDHQLILKCLLATRDYYVQKKAVTKPSQQGISPEFQDVLDNSSQSNFEPVKADIAKCAKADIPNKENNYLYLYTQFEKFWSHYPSKKSKQKAWQEFKQINPDDFLVDKIISALIAQVKNWDEQALAGDWVPPWKYPANWLAQHCWDDEISAVRKQEHSNAKHTATRAKKSPIEIFWDSCGDTDFDFNEEESGQSNTSNVVQFSNPRSS
ncbi:hypothetical protein ACM9VS_04935 [Legionella pneumophila]|uniref:hypothetical protein n=1 Tax=Legionella pneumophila TaxID=446 RepID=UPI003A4C5BF1